jgi:hypothetical protein
MPLGSLSAASLAKKQKQKWALTKLRIKNKNANIPLQN